MPGSRKARAKPRPTGDARAGSPAEPEAAAIYGLMNKADNLYKQGRYRRALRVCLELARLDPTNAMAEQMIEGCRRELLTRRVVLFGVLAALGTAGVALALIYGRLAYLGTSPEPGTLRLRERQAQPFLFRSSFGSHRTLEYTWQLLDGEGRPVPPTEEGTLAPRDGAPWERTYTPPYSLVRGDAGDRPVVRRIVASGINASGREAAHAEWVVEVTNTPMPPRILNTSPRADERLSAVVGGEGRSFRVEAADGDSGAALVYEWFVSQKPVHRAAEPTWTYRPPADALPPAKAGRETPGGPPVVLTCSVSNRCGEPKPVTVEWKVRLVRSNSPPRLVAFQPELSDIVSITEGETRAVTATAIDPDEGDTLTYLWELDGRPHSPRRTCTLSFPRGFSGGKRVVPLSLTVTDSCGAKVTRSWQVCVVSAPQAPSPP